MMGNEQVMSADKTNVGSCVSGHEAHVVFVYFLLYTLILSPYPNFLLLKYDDISCLDVSVSTFEHNVMAATHATIYLRKFRFALNRYLC